MGQTFKKNKSGKINSLRMSTTKRWFYLTIGSFLLLIAGLYFVVYAEIFSPGVAGMAQGFVYSLWDVLERINPTNENIVASHLGMEFQQFKVTIYYSIYFFMNIPIFIFTFKKFGKRFLFESSYTLVLVTSLAIGLSFTPLGNGEISFIGSADEIADAIGDNVAIARTVEFVIYSLMAIFGGLLYGLGVGIVFSIGACTMGFDPIGRYQARTTGVEIGKILFIFSFVVSFFWLFVEFLIINVGTGKINFEYFMNEVFFSPRLVATIIFLFVYSSVVSALYPSSRKYVIEVTSQKNKDISEYFNLINYHKGHTLIKAKGGYTGKETEIFKMVVNAEELIDVVEDIATIDPVSFIDVIEAKKVYGPQNWTPNTKEDRKVQADLHRRRDRKRKEHQENIDAFTAGKLKQQKGEKEFIKKQKQELQKQKREAKRELLNKNLLKLNKKLKKNFKKQEKLDNVPKKDNKK